MKGAVLALRHAASAARPLTPRCRRLLEALLTGPKSREELDRIVGASNGPEQVARARRLYGLTIPCEMHGGLDRDGLSVKFGVYSLSPADRLNAARLLQEGGEA